MVGRALEVSYRHIDTAQGYRNERGVGEAVAASGLAREEIFLTSNLNNSKHRPDDVRTSFERTLQDPQVAYFDLFSLHRPLPTRYAGDFVSTGQAMVELTEDGRLRSAGVSNSEPAHRQRIITETGVVPAVNQIEAHPYFANHAAREASAENGITVEAWGPLGQGTVLAEPVIEKVAAAHDKSDAQVILRWHLQRGDLIVPESVNPDRMRQNFDIFDFEPTAREAAAIDALDRGADGRVGPDPDVVDMIG